MQVWSPALPGAPPGSADLQICMLRDLQIPETGTWFWLRMISLVQKARLPLRQQGLAGQLSKVSRQGGG